MLRWLFQTVSVCVFLVIRVLLCYLVRVFVHFQCSVYFLYPLRVLFVELQEFSGKVWPSGQ